MAVSVFDLFKIGIGPSSSHTVGPMRAALMFVRALERCEMLPFVARVRAELYGSLGATGKGHGTDKGVILGLLGEAPDTIDADTIEPRLLEVTASGQLALAGHHDVPFNARRDVAFYRQALPEHPNGLRLLAYREDGSIVRESTYLSVGGGFVVTAGADNSRMLDAPLQLPYRFSSGKELLNLCRENELSIAELMMQNELVWRTEAEIVEGLRRIWGVMQACVDRGCRNEGNLTGPLGVKATSKGTASTVVAQGWWRRPVFGRDGLAQPLCACSQRGECQRRPSRDCTNQRCGRHHPRRDALLHEVYRHG